MTNLSPAARALIDDALREEEPTAADRARVRAGLGTRIAVAGGVVASTSAAAASAKIAGLAKLLALLAVIGTLGVALSVDPADPAAVVPPRAAPATPAPLQAPAPARERARVEPPPLVPEAPAVAPRRASSVPAQPSKPEATPPEEVVAPAPGPVDMNTLKAETALLRKAHIAMRSGDAAEALALLERHAREYPQGQLGEEREAAKVLALCHMGKKEQARRAAQRFLDDGAPVAERIKSVCGF